MSGKGHQLNDVPGSHSAISASYFKSSETVSKTSLTRQAWAGLRGELHRWLSVGAGIPGSPFTYNEMAFRSLLRHEMKRSGRSGRSFHVVLVHVSGSDGEAVRMDGIVIGILLSAMAGAVRETDYIGWYRDGHIIGSVLTTSGEFASKEAVSRIEHRFLRKMRVSMPAEEFFRLRLQFCRPEDIDLASSSRHGAALS